MGLRVMTSALHRTLCISTTSRHHWGVFIWCYLITESWITKENQAFPAGTTKNANYSGVYLVWRREQEHKNTQEVHPEWAFGPWNLLHGWSKRDIGCKHCHLFVPHSTFVGREKHEGGCTLGGGGQLWWWRSSWGWKASRSKNSKAPMADDLDLILEHGWQKRLLGFLNMAGKKGSQKPCFRQRRHAAFGDFAHCPFLHDIRVEILPPDSALSPTLLPSSLISTISFRPWLLPNRASLCHLPFTMHPSLSIHLVSLLHRVLPSCIMDHFLLANDSISKYFFGYFLMPWR